MHKCYNESCMVMLPHGQSFCSEGCKNAYWKSRDEHESKSSGIAYIQKRCAEKANEGRKELKRSAMEEFVNTDLNSKGGDC